MSDYRGLLKELGALTPPLFVFGGFAEDALLFGSVSRSHADVDVFVARDELNQRLEQFHEMGFEQFDTLYEVEAEKPLVLNGSRGELHLELAILERDATGLYFVVRDQPEGRKCRIYLPADAFTCEPGILDDVEVRTVSPLALYQVREALRMVNAFGELRPTDIESQAWLMKGFFANAPPLELTPRIEYDPN